VRSLAVMATAAAFQGLQGVQGLQGEKGAPGAPGSDEIGPFAALLGSAPGAEDAARVHWGRVAGVPAGFADGVDDGITYAADAPLVVSGTTIGLQSVGCPAGGIWDSGFRRLRPHAGHRRRATGCRLRHGRRGGTNEVRGRDEHAVPLRRLNLASALGPSKNEGPAARPLVTSFDRLSRVGRGLGRLRRTSEH
jgi:hypothetical protein